MPKRKFSRLTNDQKQALRGELDHGLMAVGSPETVARKIATTLRTLGATRFQLKYSNGRLPHDLRMSSIRLYGEQVVPRVRELMGEA